MCYYPRFIRNKRYTETKKNGGVVPAVNDWRTMYVPVGCQECKECRNQKARSWQVRMLEDIKNNTNGKFITLTFSNGNLRKLHNYTINKIDASIDKLQNEKRFGKEEIKKINKLKSLKEGYNLDNEIATQAIHLWRERWRKLYQKSPRHFLVTELGHNGTENIHLHGIIWTDEGYDKIRDTWGYGYIWPRPEIKREWQKNYVSEKTVNYIIKYIIKQDKDHYGYKSKILTSLGIGHEYTESYNAISNRFKHKGETNECYRTKSGHKIAMPIYWRNKIYSEEEREKLWIQKLDKQIRYVGGEKIDISKGMDEYYNTLEWYRKRNTELGYGGGNINWTKKEYEEQRRKAKLLERIYSKEDAKFIIENEAPF